jgi:putative hydrolase of the HAD superfamily
MVITKGDLQDQENKMTRSGLSEFFRDIEVVSDKTEAAYAAVLAKHRVAPARFLMVGNSLRSDILPVTAIGGHAVYIPYELTWAHEAVEALEGEKPYEEIASIRYLPDLIASMSRSG